MDKLLQKAIQDINYSLNLPYDENVYFDLIHLQGKTYEAGIKLDIKTRHIIFNGIYKHCKYYCDFEKLEKYPKITSSKNVYNIEKISITKKETDELKSIFNDTVKYRNQLLEYEDDLSAFEGTQYKVRVKNNFYTVLARIHNMDFEAILDNYYLETLDITYLSNIIHQKIKEIKERKVLETFIGSKDYHKLISALQNYKNIGCKADIRYIENTYSQQKPGLYISLWLYKKCIYNSILNTSTDGLICITQKCKKEIDKFINNYEVVTSLVSKINNCKNRFWKAEFLFNFEGKPEIKIDQTCICNKNGYITYEKISLSNYNLSDKENIICAIKERAIQVIKNMELYGYRIMEVCQNEK